LLTANIYQVSKGMNTVTVPDYFQPDAPQRTIPLDVRLSPSENAQRFYRKYSKLKTAQIEVKRQMDEAQGELAYLDSVLTAIDTSREPSDIEQIQAELAAQGYLKANKKGKGPKKTKDPFNPLQFRSAEGFEILVGRNNLENDRLTLKTASNSDLWFHTKEIPGSHVVIRTQGQEVPEETLALAARIAAWHSKGREGENIAVDYTQVRHVRKPAGARPGMVIYDHQRTLYVTPVESEIKTVLANTDKKSG
jgi:predicted ribosome quality control (RQC) complex YloA/Tae2 family protein